MKKALRLHRRFAIWLASPQGRPFFVGQMTYWAFVVVASLAGLSVWLPLTWAVGYHLAWIVVHFAVAGVYEEREREIVKLLAERMGEELRKAASAARTDEISQRIRHTSMQN